MLCSSLREAFAIPGRKPILEIGSAGEDIQADIWHIDWSCMDAHPKISVLRDVVIPLVGGDTVWSNTAAAYLDLPAPLQRIANPGAYNSHYVENFVGPKIETELGSCPYKSPPQIGRTG